MAALEGLSERDRAVLRCIFDPTVTIAADVVDDGDTFPQENDLLIVQSENLCGMQGAILPLKFSQIPQTTTNRQTARRLFVSSEDIFASEPSQEAVPESHKESVALCARGVQLAEAGNLEEALQQLNKGVEAAPDRPEAYNDRAQLLRLLQRDEDAIKDITRTIELTSDKKCRARALALCQHGVLLRKQQRDDEARAAFKEAAELGSGFAKKQMVELNPYAALCNQMLSQVMRGEKEIQL